MWKYRGSGAPAGLFPASPTPCLGLPALLPSKCRRETEARAQRDGWGWPRCWETSRDKWRKSLDALRRKLGLSNLVFKAKG